MTLLKDLSIITSDPVRAKSIHRIVFAKGRPRQQAYDYLVEVARQAGLGIVRLCALLLKYDEERRERAGDAKANGSLCGGDAWSARVFFNAVSSYDEERYRVFTHHDLTLLVAELTLLGLRDLPTNSEALAYVEEQLERVFGQLAEADEETVKNYCSLKRLWLLRNIELKSLDANLEEQLENAASIRRAFMKIFGKEFLAERAQLFRMNVAERRLQLFKDNPGINEVDLERMLGKGKGRQDSNLSRHQLGLPVGCFLSRSAGSKPLDGEYARARSLLRNLATLTHPDKLRQHELSWSQREQLESIWHEIAPLRAESNNKTILTRSVPFLESKLQLARRIMELAHIEDLDASLVVQGSTIEEQVQWLEGANEFLDKRMRCLQADSLHCSRNKELDDMRKLSEAPEEVQEAERQAMVEKCEAFSNNADALERRAVRLISACA